jgi:predicted dehydrogenase
MASATSDRRDFLATGAALFSTSLFTGNIRGANARVRVGYIGLGKMGRDNMKAFQKVDGIEPVAVCDVFERNLKWGVDIGKGQVKAHHDFREILADKSIDAVCISTPDHWHAYMAIEACKAGKDVYVEKPIAVAVDEAAAMVAAARKYSRVVQAGTWQRSTQHFREAVDIVRSGELGKVAVVQTWNTGNFKQEGIGNPPDGDPPAGLDWDMWLGPAQKRPFNANRFGVDPDDHYFSNFRWFWEYAGGMMTDWGIHLLDIVQMAYGEEMPKTITGLGGKYWLTDNRETPDTLHVAYEYPSGFVATYENRNSNALWALDKGYGILFLGEKATLFVDRSEYRVIPEKGSDAKKREGKVNGNGHHSHWANFIECVRSRQKPNSDIENCQRSTTTCLLGNVAYRSKTRLDFDASTWKVSQAEAQPLLTREYRAPWKLEV